MNLLPVEFHKENNYGVEEDFLHGSFATTVALGNGFTATHAVGAIATGDARGGVGVITWTAAAAEFNSYVTTNEIFEFVADKPIRFKAIVTPGLTAELPEELNIFVGCMEGMDTATEMQAVGAGPRADSDMFGFFTVENGGAVYPLSEDVWHCVSSFGALQIITPLLATNPNNLSGADQTPYLNPAGVPGDGIERVLTAEWVPVNQVPGVAGVAPTLFDAEVRFRIDGILVAKHLMRGAFQITTATTEEMNFGVVGSNLTDIAVLNMDYLKCEQVR